MEAKGTGRAIAESLAEEVLQASTPAFEVFDQNTKGGIMVTPDSQLFELRHPYWANGSTLLPGRSTLLPYRKSGPDGGIEYTGPRCDPTYYSRGIEAEIATSDSSGRPYKISPNGIELVWPDGSTNSLEEFNFDPEALQYQFEFASKVAYSDEEHRSNFITVAYQVERLLEQHGLTHAGLSLFPHAYNEKEWSNHPYVRLVKPWMRAFREFGIMSNQLTVGTGDPEAAMYALNEYQKYAAAISWATEAAPIRDSSFETTVGEHYGKQGEELSDPGKAAYLPAEVFEVLGEDTVFHDHREIARVAGSPSAGVYSSPAPQDLEVFLRSADHLLRGGHVVSSGRTLGWHTDRFREQARVEICNIATAGGNQERVLATHELVGRFIMAKMLEYDRMTPEDRLQRLANYALEAAHAQLNNIRVGLHGRDAELTAPTQGSLQELDQQSGQNTVTTPGNMLQSMLDYVKANHPDGVPEAAEIELRAVASANPKHELQSYSDIDALYDAYFQPASGLTATEVLKHAHSIAPHMSLDTLLAKFSQSRRQHVYEMAGKYGVLVRAEAAATP